MRHNVLAAMLVSCLVPMAAHAAQVEQLLEDGGAGHGKHDLFADEISWPIAAIHGVEMRGECPDELESSQNSMHAGNFK
jgi:hypothetical protein